MMMKNKGQITIGLMMLIGLAFMFVLITGTMLYLYGIVDVSLGSGNIAGNGVNISNISDNTIGKVNDAFINSADLIAVLFIFGFILGLFIAAYMLRGQTPLMFFMVDFILIIFAYILAIYVSNTYETVLAALPYSATIITNMNLSSSLLLNLPRLIIITGAITMIISYAGIPRTKEEEIGGF